MIKVITRISIISLICIVLNTEITSLNHWVIMCIILPPVIIHLKHYNIKRSIIQELNNFIYC